MYKQEFCIEREDYVNAGKVSTNVKNLLKQLSIPTDVLRRIAVACYEAEINMIIHSYGGKISLEISDEMEVKLSFHDVGPGIQDIEKAMMPGFSTASKKAREFGFGAGMGLPNIKRVSDNFELTTSSSGTHLKIGFKL